MTKDIIKIKLKELIENSENELAIEKEFRLDKISLVIYSREDNTKLESIIYGEDIENDIYKGENICDSDYLYYVSDILLNAYHYNKNVKSSCIGEEALDYLAEIILMNNKKIVEYQAI